VGVSVDAETGAVVIGGWNLEASRKFRNIETNPQVALVVDDVASLGPWKVRGVQIRGVTEALSHQREARTGMRGEVIRSSSLAECTAGVSERTARRVRGGTSRRLRSDRILTLVMSWLGTARQRTRPRSPLSSR